MAVDVEESSFLECIQMWIKRGSLFEMMYYDVNFFFKAVKYKHNSPHLHHANLTKQHLVQSIMGKEDIQIL